MKLLRVFKKISTKLILGFLLVGLVPLLISSFIASSKTGSALEKESFAKLDGLVKT